MVPALRPLVTRATGIGQQPSLELLAPSHRREARARRCRQQRSRALRRHLEHAPAPAASRADPPWSWQAPSSEDSSAEEDAFHAFFGPPSAAALSVISSTDDWLSTAAEQAARLAAEAVAADGLGGAGGPSPHGLRQAGTRMAAALQAIGCHVEVTALLLGRRCGLLLLDAAGHDVAAKLEAVQVAAAGGGMAERHVQPTACALPLQSR